MRVSGRVIPLPVKPVPEVVICEMLRFAPPLFVIVRDFALLLPTNTLPKLRLVGLDVI